MNKLDRQRYITVPNDYEAMQALEYGNEEPNQVTEWKLLEEEFEQLYNLGIFELLNNECDIIIDDFESEWLENEALSKAIKILEKRYESNETEVITKLKELVCLAIKSNTCVAFDF